LLGFISLCPSSEGENFENFYAQVIEAAVIGIPDRKWTERPLLVVVPKPGQQVSSDELLGFFQVWPRSISLSMALQSTKN
jgi:acyl-CoA synthetase (AMP-forming)/AMP-acid ligase II